MKIIYRPGTFAFGIHISVFPAFESWVSFGCYIVVFGGNA